MEEKVGPKAADKKIVRKKSLLVRGTDFLLLRASGRACIPTRATAFIQRATCTLAPQEPQQLLCDLHTAWEHVRL